MKILSITLVLIISILFSGCATKDETKAPVKKVTEKTIDKSLKIGMSQLDVMDIFGSPHNLKKDDTGTETWIYDFTPELLGSKSLSKYYTQSLEQIRALFEKNKELKSVNKKNILTIHFDKSKKVSGFSFN